MEGKVFIQLVNMIVVKGIMGKGTPVGPAFMAGTEIYYMEKSGQLKPMPIDDNHCLRVVEIKDYKFG